MTGLTGFLRTLHDTDVSQVANATRQVPESRETEPDSKPEPQTEKLPPPKNRWRIGLLFVALGILLALFGLFVVCPWLFPEEEDVAKDRGGDGPPSLRAPFDANTAQHFQHKSAGELKVPFKAPQRALPLQR